MRVFSSHEFGVGRTTAALRAGAILALACLGSLVVPGGATGQWPAELGLRVIDASTGAVVQGARIEVLGTSLIASTSADGFALFRGVPPGTGEVRVSALGYEPSTRRFSGQNGLRQTLLIDLSPHPFLLDPIEAKSTGAMNGIGSVHVTGESLRRSAAATLGEAIAALPGLSVRKDGAGSAERISVRGSPSDAVLVLVDGVPINDPVTGAADLARVPVGQILSVVLHRGAASARFGPRARAGALEVTTAGGSETLDVNLLAGSLGQRSARVSATHRKHRTVLSGGAEFSRVVGMFDYALPWEAGGGSGLRRNADMEKAALWAGSDFSSGRVRSTLRATGDQIARGLPGPGYGPAEHARQRDRGGQISGTLEAAAGRVALHTQVRAAFRNNRAMDSDPPAGQPYDERSRVSDLGAGVRAAVAGWGGGTVDVTAEVSRVAVESTALSEFAPEAATHGGLGAGWRRPLLGEMVTASARLRADRDGWTGRTRLNHALGISASHDGLSAQLTHRSSFSPPTLADQFFSEGVAIRPNPDLRGERIPGELELALRAERRRWGAGASIYEGDVEDLIVWQPDFRFVWSPSNTNVRRSGGELWAEGRGASLPWVFRGSLTHNRLTYDRGGDADTVQVAYRPRNSGALGADWSGVRWGAGVQGRYVGRRFPVPAPINALPGFWTWDAQAYRRAELGSWTVQARVRVRRLFDQRSTLIFGYPDPGRTLGFEVTVTPGEPL